jgi:3-hydroxybutyryl-CoA dehydratase
MDKRRCLGRLGFLLALCLTQRESESEQCQGEDTDGETNKKHGTVVQLTVRAPTMIWFKALCCPNNFRDAKMLPLQMLYFEDLSVGMTETLKKIIDSSDVVGFAEVTGDRNPIHLSEHFAAKTPFGTRIAHGLYPASLISAVLGTRLPGPGAVYISQTLNFRAPVKIGDTVDVSVMVAELMPEKFRARLTCTCSVEGEVVLDGEAWVKVPSKDSGGRPMPRI